MLHPHEGFVDRIRGPQYLRDVCTYTGNSGVKMLFQVASVLTVLLLGFSLLLALAGTAIEYSRLTTRPETEMDFPLRMTASASLICLLVRGHTYLGPSRNVTQVVGWWWLTVLCAGAGLG